jgi:hypothetical protein
MTTPTINIVRYDGSVVEVKVHAQYGLLAITDSLTRTTRDCYCITHSVTGVKVRTYKFLGDAIAAAKAWQHFDWEFKLGDREHVSKLGSEMAATPHWTKGF